jgi:hypothetical protein
MPMILSSIVSERTNVQLCDEFFSIQLWALAKKMVIHKDKPKEIVFHRPNLRHCSFVPCVIGFEITNEVKLILVVCNDTLHFTGQCNLIL